jgi:hypothetical protein
MPHNRNAQFPDANRRRIRRFAWETPSGSRALFSVKVYLASRFEVSDVPSTLETEHDGNEHAAMGGGSAPILPCVPAD